MAKKGGSKTRQGLRDLAMPEGYALTREPVREWVNVTKSIATYQTDDGAVEMPLNRSMRRYAKHIGINTKKATK